MQTLELSETDFSMGGLGFEDDPEPRPATNTATGYRIDCGHEACRTFYGIQIAQPSDETSPTPEF